MGGDGGGIFDESYTLCSPLSAHYQEGATDVEKEKPQP